MCRCTNNQEVGLEAATLQRNKFSDFHYEDSASVMIETIRLTPRSPYYKHNLLFSSSLLLGLYSYDPTATGVDVSNETEVVTHNCYIANNSLSVS